MTDKVVLLHSPRHKNQDYTTTVQGTYIVCTPNAVHCTLEAVQCAPWSTRKQNQPHIKVMSHISKECLKAKNISICFPIYLCINLYM